MEDTVRLALGGTVALSSFALALDRLTKVLEQLSDDAGARIEWVVAGLDYGSASAAAAGRPLDAASEALLPEVVRAFGEGSEATAYGRPSTLSQKSLRLLEDIADLVDHGVEEVRLETAEKEAVFRTGRNRPRTSMNVEPSKDRGTVMGRVQTLQGRGQLRFTLYDLAHDRAVSCWLSTGQEELMRDAWGHLVEVEGTVSRDPETNSPLAVRRVTDVRLFDDPLPERWLRARGAALATDARSSEQVIRELRDAW